MVESSNKEKNMNMLMKDRVNRFRTKQIALKMTKANFNFFNINLTSLYGDLTHG